MERKTYCDYLRIMAIFSVVVIHVSALHWYNTDVNGIQWQAFNFYDSVCRWGVPIFVMISGSLFLNRDISIKKIYSKYILRMITAFFVWTNFYALVRKDTIKKGIIFGIKTHLHEIASGHYHMYFIFMIIGLYMCIPFYKKIVEDRLIMKYFLLLSFLCSSLFPWIIQLINDYAADSNEFIAKAIDVIKSNMSQMSLYMVLGYSFYFILGYYLDNIELNTNQRTIIYILGIIGFIFTVSVNLNVALKMQKVCDNYYGYFNVNVVCETICIHTLLKYHNYKSDRLNSFMTRVSDYIFGVYLIHAFFIDHFFAFLKFDTLSFNAFISVPVISIIVSVCSLLVSAIINHLPFINRYIV